MSSFPSHLIDPLKKDREWRLKYIQAAWNEYGRGGYNSFYGQRQRYGEIDDYSHARQTIIRYKKILDVDEAADSSWLKVNWDNLPIARKFRKMAMGRLNKFDYNIVATPVDPLATSEIENYFADQEAKIEARGMMEQVPEDIISLTPFAKGPNDPADMEELEIFKKFSYKHRMAVEMEDALNLIYFQNRFWEIRNKVKEDIFDYGAGIIKEWVDSNGAIKVKRCHPESIIISRCVKRDFSDRDYIGEIFEITFSQLKQWAGDQFSPTEYEHIASMLVGQPGNPSKVPTNASSDYYNDFKLRLLDLEWFSVNDTVYERGRDKLGNRKVSRAEYRRRSQNYVRKAMKVVYRGTWIIGTEYLFNDGLATDMKRARSRLMDTTDSFHVFSPDFSKMRLRSKMEDAIPIIDSIQLSWLKLQQAMAEARPKGVQIELGAIEDVSLGAGKKKLDAYGIVDLFLKKGILLYRRLNLEGDPANFNPIEELTGGIGDEAVRWYNAIQSGIQLLRDAWGLNELTDASTPNPKILTTVARLAEEGTNNALWDIVEADKWLLQDLSESLVLRLQSVIRRRPIEGYIQALGDRSVKFIRTSPDVSAHEFGIKLENRPTDQERERLLQYAHSRVDSGLVEFEDIVMIENSENLKEAQLILARRIEKRKEKQQQEAKEMQQVNAQVQIQSAQAAEKAKQDTLSLEHQFKLEILQEEKDLDLRNQNARMEAELEIEQIRAGVRLQGDLIGADSKELIAEMNQGPLPDTSETGETPS